MKNLNRAVTIAALLVLAGCATINSPGTPWGADRTAQGFFDYLQGSRYEAAYGLLGKGISQRISFDQFEQFMHTLHEEWGRLISDDTSLVPFHTRPGEQNFIPLHTDPKVIKRYTFDVKFDNAEMNFDLTLVPDEQGSYRIVWFSVWGSSIYMTPKVQQTIEELFSKPE